MYRQLSSRLNRTSTNLTNTTIAILAVCALTACGGGGGGSSRTSVAPTPPPATAQSDFERGIFRDFSLFENQCRSPRAGNFPDVQGSTETENEWLRAWSHDLYLWYDEIVDEDPAAFSTPEYFDLMRTFATTPSGADRDQFHFTIDTETWLALSQSGISAGYGADFTLISATPPREIIVSLVQAGSPADPGLARGARVLQVDGVDAVNGNLQSDVDVINAGLFPNGPGETHTLVVEDFDGQNQRTVTLTSANVTQDPVPNASVINTASGPVGYLLFNTHIATAEQRLFDEMGAFEAAGITDLVLDLRYNGGGFSDIANELAFMIAGPAAAGGRVFDEIQFNDKHPTINPVTGAALTPATFHQVAQGFSVAAGTALPSVNLSRVFVLSGPDTCSASEVIINGLRGIGIEVILIGETTCGKPYGFFPTDNCGTTYFTIQFRGVNEVGFGDYADGFIPTETPVEQFEVQGCPVTDDFSRALGDPNELRLSTALSYISTGTCPPPVRGAFAASTRKATTLTPSSEGRAIQPKFVMPGSIRQ